MNDFREYSAAFHANNNDLIHYGVLGMKWGVRRTKLSDGSSARKLTRDLNKLDRQKARNQYAINRTNEKINRYLRKGNRDKADKWKYHLKQLEASKKYADKETDQILNSKNMKKYDLKKAPTSRLVMSPGLIALAALTRYAYLPFYKGTKYKVKNKKKAKVVRYERF